MWLKIILWYLKKMDVEYTIRTNDHIYMNYPNAVFNTSNPSAILHVDEPNVAAKDKLDLSQFKSPGISTREI